MKTKHLLTSDEKLLWWGYGEWVEEPDLVEFTHNGIECIILRMYDKGAIMFSLGGHLCGYCKIPKNHPHYDSPEGKDMPYEIHGGITFAEINIMNGNKGYWIGFDCAHSEDIIPSRRVFDKRMMERSEFYREFIEKNQEFYDKFEMLKSIYRNIEYVKEECKNLAKQIIEAYDIAGNKQHKTDSLEGS